MPEELSFESLEYGLRAGDGDAAAIVFRRFTRRLVALARSRLESTAKGGSDAEDVIQSVYRSFFTRCAEGQFEIQDWEGLWGLLALITLRKCANRRTYHRARRRDVRREAVSLQDLAPGTALELADREPSPLEAVVLADTVAALVLGFDQADRQTVSLILQGYTELEIAAIVACSERTVRRVRSRLKGKLESLYRVPQEDHRAS
jgi:RNA polymerase sigma-70 factor (ECF subfamily)